jgi:phosphohistidine swiveling domain-containing protein
MKNEKIIWGGSNPHQYNRSTVGGKGLNLLYLAHFADVSGMITIPDFFIIPVNSPRHFSNSNEGTRVVFKDSEIRRTFDAMRKPVIARSSSPLEDGLNASFAGMFVSKPGIKTWDEFCYSSNSIYESEGSEHVEKYAEKMGIEGPEGMAVIVQEQVTDFFEKGVIQLDKTEGVIEVESPKGKRWLHDIDYRFLDEWGPWNVYEETHDYISEGETHNVCQRARDAAKFLGLEGTVQVEFLLAPAKKPFFVQIRQLPAIKSYAASLDIDIPKGVPFLESQVCNGVAGEVRLPAYVTFSQAGFTGVEIETGCKSLDERYEKFMAESKLAHTDEFFNAQNANALKLIRGTRECVKCFEEMWEAGNKQFPAYVLVCDKLDESVCGMNNLTSNKKAIITCLEASKTSHAMTVARDLGIPAMGVRGEMMDMGYFFNQVETGDLIHMKSDGKRAVAYIQKKAYEKKSA